MQLRFIQKGLPLGYKLYFVWKLFIVELTLHVVLLKTWGATCTIQDGLSPGVWDLPVPVRSVCTAMELAIDHQHCHVD